MSSPSSAPGEYSFVLTDLSLAVAILQNDVKAVNSNMNAARVEHKEMVEKFSQLERRVDSLVSGVELVNKQLMQFILQSQNTAESADNDLASVQGRVASLEVASREDAAREEERNKVSDFNEKHKASALTRWNVILACFMVFLTALEVWDKLIKGK